jgi:hypothetical protein
MDANIQQEAKRKAPGKPSVKPKVRGAMGLELRAAIAKAKAEAMRELEGIDYTQAPRDPKKEPLKVWKRPPARPECCHVRRSPQHGKGRHKPKQGKGRKLTDIAASLPKPSAAIPMLFHLLRRFVDKQEPGNKFEAYVFEHLARLEGKQLDSLVGGLEAFVSVKEPYRSTLFDDRFDHWSPKQSIGSSLMHWTLLDDSIMLKWGRGLDTLFMPGKVRPWSRMVGVGDFQRITAPWPWINEVEGLRTVDHISPINYYFPIEYEGTVSWMADPNTGQPIMTPPEQSRYPACSVAPQRDKQDLCLRVHEVRVGGSVTLTGFNYFSWGAKVNLTRFDGNVMGDTFVVDGFLISDPSTPLKDKQGNVIADHRVTDRLMFDIPTMTPDGLYQFPPGVYAVSVTMPNDVHYTSADGTQETEFTSNTAYLRVLPAGNEKYRIWTDQAHCYDPTNGEWGSDELALDIITATVDAATNQPVATSQGVFGWNGVEGGDSTSYIWNLLGSPGQPESINGFFAMGLLGWEVDSEDALNDSIRGFGAAFTQYWGIIWAGIVAVGGLGAAASVLGTILAGAAWWITLIVVAVILIIATIVGLIWAAWAPPDRIIVDIIALSETQFYYLTLPTGVPPPPQQLAVIPEVQTTVTPEPKSGAYLYTEERRYDCSDEGSSYGFHFKYERNV